MANFPVFPTDFWPDDGTGSTGGGVTATGALATIPIGQTQTQYRKIALWVTPSSAVTYSVEYEREVTDLVNAKDQPSLPVRFHHLLAIGARRKEYDKKDDTRYRTADREYTQGLNDLKYFVASGADVRPVMGRRVIARPSTLGGWYPAGS